MSEHDQIDPSETVDVDSTDASEAESAVDRSNETP